MIHTLFQIVFLTSLYCLFSNFRKRLFSRLWFITCFYCILLLFGRALFFQHFYFVFILLLLLDIFQVQVYMAFGQIVWPIQNIESSKWKRKYNSWNDIDPFCFRLYTSRQRSVDRVDGTNFSIASRFLKSTSMISR